ncbi:hypothetical protein BCR32DRAFT_330035 [Anaeromyces robustus]|uniref:Surface antigen BspA-like n=1 Tax=Anaeromyces robustus TaxID=1754192 RepID=A0A1Y1WGA0_9FUNG|nr:hypothetical protein BCR32DRAFT_330035 [Anaeromyces robustus]|eukprot:ORX72571.1 hypothetical protein BCR32DRAFT_330035 [Anaeromyces robustus]
MEISRILKLFLFFINFIGILGKNSGSCGNNVNWEYDPSSGELTISGEGPMKDYNERESIPWYTMKDDIKSVEIKNGVTTVGQFSFYNCSSITNVIIPNTVVSINSGSFLKCKSLTSITIPDFVTLIGKEAFGSCSSLTSVIIGESVNTIESYAFEFCDNIETFVYKGHKSPTCRSNGLFSDRNFDIDVPDDYEGDTFCEEILKLDKDFPFVIIIIIIIIVIIVLCVGIYGILKCIKRCKKDKN